MDLDILLHGDSPVASLRERNNKPSTTIAFSCLSDLRLPWACAAYAPRMSGASGSGFTSEHIKPTLGQRKQKQASTSTPNRKQTCCSTYGFSSRSLRGTSSKHLWNRCGQASKLSRLKQQQQQEALNPRHAETVRKKQWLIAMRLLTGMQNSLTQVLRIHVDPLREGGGVSNSNTTMRITQPRAEPPLSTIAYGRMKREHGDGIYMHRDGSTFVYPSNVEQAPCRNPILCMVCYIACHLQHQLLHTGCPRGPFLCTAYVPCLPRPWFQHFFDSKHMQGTWLTKSNRSRKPGLSSIDLAERIGAAIREPLDEADEAEQKRCIRYAGMDLDRGT